MGADWAITTSAAELENAGEGGTTDNGSGQAYAIANDDTFIDSEYAEDLYDDILLWMSPYVLYGYLIEAGRLP